jgi:hypothetical protein
MSEQVEIWRAMRAFNKAFREAFGVDCPGCRKKEPKRIPTRLVPGQRCRVCGYRDPRLRQQ